MEGEAWWFNAIDFEPNIDDSEDFDLQVAAKTANNLDHLHPSSASSFAHQEHHESVQSEGLYHRKTARHGWPFSQKWHCIPATNCIRMAGGHGVLSWRRASITDYASSTIDTRTRRETGAYAFFVVYWLELQYHLLEQLQTLAEMITDP